MERIFLISRSSFYIVRLLSNLFVSLASHLPRVIGIRSQLFNEFQIALYRFQAMLKFAYYHVYLLIALYFSSLFVLKILDSVLICSNCFQTMVRSMISLDPSERLSAFEYRNKFKGLKRTNYQMPIVITFCRDCVSN